jgi:peptidoglycan/xylan/chitin deacetylase (PgdA/CDA1 family)
LNRLGFVLSSRGLKNTLARTWQVATRFGITAARMEKRLMAYSGMVADYGGRPSLPITAVVLDRNPDVARRLMDEGVELCVHGLIHTDMARLPDDIQEEHIRSATEVFNKNGIEFEGFRSPYLKYNRATLVAVEKAGFKYDSNLPFYWGTGEALRDLSAEEADGLSRGLRFYRPVKYPAERSLPRYVGGIIEIPVSLPDDEIMLDRMGLPVNRVGDAWTEMAQHALARGELLTLQLHPERVLHLEAALRRVLEFARDGSAIWITTMKELAAWWDARTRATVDVVPVEKGTYRAALSGPAGLGLTLQSPTAGADRTTTGETIQSPRRPLIGVPEDASRDLRRFIRQLGYFYEITADRGIVNLYIDRDTEGSEVERVIEACPEPLLADTRWPGSHKAALTVTGDIDCLTLGDFLRRFREG